MNPIRKSSLRNCGYNWSYQQLETRNLLTGITLDASTGILLIEGSREQDQVFVTSLSNTKIQVEFVDVETEAFDVIDVISIRFNGRPGADMFVNETAIESAAFGHGGNDILSGGSGNDVLSGGGGDDILSGNGGDDQLQGLSGDDVLHGGDGDDFLNGFSGVDELNGGDGNDVILGGDGNDRINGGVGDDEIFGQKGDDEIRDSFISTGGNDTIFGNSGNDTIIAGGGKDTVYGGDGDDNIEGSGDADEIRGGVGNDTVRGGDGHDLIYGGDGNDWLVGNSRGDVIYGGNGDDRLSGELGGMDILYGGDGDDLLLAGPGKGFDRLFGGNGNDVLEGSNREDLLIGSDGDDVIEGGQGPDEIIGGNGNDTISGGYGDDVIFGQAGNDSIGGGPGNDMVYGGTGNDYIRGAGDDDQLFGGEGNDRIYGAGGFDQIFGGAGLDGLSGGPADPNDPNQLYGGTESDRFLTGTADYIADFATEDVQIEFRNSIGSKWTHGEIQGIDRGLWALHLRVGNNLLLKDTRTSNPIVIQKAASLPDSMHLGQNNFDNATMERVISFESFDHRDAAVASLIRLEVIREMALNWASDSAISSVLPDQGNFFSEFEALSSWTIGPVDDESQFILSGDESQYYLVDASFADDPLATFNSKEDFASIWRLTFDSQASSDGILPKLATIDLLLSRFVLI